MAYDWTELTYLQNQTGNTAIYVFALAVVFVFLVLAAQYESWKLPLAVILVVPMCLLCSAVGVEVGRLGVTVFTQIGFVVLVGLASKNAILIVEFARRQQTGVPLRQATMEACRLRLRPILMTSFAFILGVVPLVIATGAGAETRRSLGTAVFAGMLGVTLFGIFLTPVFFHVLGWFGGGKLAPQSPSESTASGHCLGCWGASSGPCPGISCPAASPAASPVASPDDGFSVSSPAAPGRRRLDAAGGNGDGMDRGGRRGGTDRRRAPGCLCGDDPAAARQARLPGPPVHC
jgi:hypothetical protein